MALLRFKNTTPPFGGWRYRQKESALIITGESLGDLIQRVIAHRAHKGFQPLDADSIQVEIERQICGRLTKNECITEGTEDEWVPVRGDSDVMDLEKIKSFSHAGWEWLKAGGKLIPIEEAKRRAEICRECPANCDTGHDCFNCTLGKLIRLAVPEKRRFYGLQICGYCGCDLQSKVNLPDSVIVASDKGRDIEYPSWCWQREILERNKKLALHTE